MRGGHSNVDCVFVRSAAACDTGNWWTCAFTELQGICSNTYDNGSITGNPYVLQAMIEHTYTPQSFPLLQLTHSITMGSAPEDLPDTAPAEAVA
jgi:hypothetical protein